MSFTPSLDFILREGLLTAVFQPITSLRQSRILGYEGLIRGPSDSPLHVPERLLGEAAAAGRLFELDVLCRRVIIRRFGELGLEGLLFLNVSPAALVDPQAVQGSTLAMARDAGIAPQQVVIELTEQQPIADFGLMCKAVEHYRRMGFSIALDDLGAGYNSLRHWSELRPDYVKIDKHFVQNVHNDPVKRQFIQSIREIAHGLGTRVIAEGIETRAELETLRGMEIGSGQGYYFARPQADPPRVLGQQDLAYEGQAGGRRRLPGQTAGVLCRPNPSVGPELELGRVVERFQRDAALKALTVVEAERPVGLVRRQDILALYSQRFTRELHDRSPVRYFMQRDFLVASADMPLEELSAMVTSTEDVEDVFIIVDEAGHYLGMARLLDLLKRITVLQISYARYANPLTQLPGNVPLNEYMDGLLNEGVNFVVAYCDLDHFKPFNDYYGYARGDEVIRALGSLLLENVDHVGDFVGHVGGDDFVLVLAGGDWEQRCRRLLQAFDAMAPGFYEPEDLASGGIRAKDRQGRETFYPMLSLSIGVVPVSPDRFHSHLDIAHTASEAKHQAKAMEGSSLFVDRRRSILPQQSRETANNKLSNAPPA
ncbi:bifunctional diguanylate cyclase/phosphodiesterase [Thioalkalivibrio sulfidiphilus]|uniref:bifunctional diguanylate cyclase/phosphodiesterase n=1 Tax=Thioalkalivibrio sulfidiphilus TaxID=1033854 RepID=UPI00039F4F63|nr:bifunctional diguanylate cyclase/phosphodiesterase [Thioalkalivibrio sulfidiphilus]